MLFLRIRNVLRPLHVCNSIAFKRYLSEDSKNELLEAVNAVKQIRFRASRLNFVPGTAFSKTLSHELIDRNGNFTDTRFCDSNEPFFSYEVLFGSLFKEGLKLFEKFLLENDVNLTSSTGHGPNLRTGMFVQAAGVLVDYIENLGFHQMCMQHMIQNFLKETDVATILAVHLFYQLTVKDSPSYFVTNDYSRKYYLCPCGNRDCEHEVLYGNTNVGSPYLFYGRPDIVVLPKGAGSCSVVIPKNNNKLQEVTEIEEDSEIQLVEVKTSHQILRHPATENQVASLAVAFSFFQRIKQHRRQILHSSSANLIHPYVSIIPTIAICRDSFDLYMYDVDNDIFLKSAGNPIPLWKDSENISLTSVLAIWMVINHLTFRPKITKSMNSLFGSCGFKENLDKNRLALFEKSIGMATLKSMPVEKIEKHAKQTKVILLQEDSD